ncbi:MAG: phosphatase PAP2 family protein [Chloroflexota bacterium]|nr:phosphatase PAP2 family protein [Chloroflexota bacterium]
MSFRTGITVAHSRSLGLRRAILTPVFCLLVLISLVFAAVFTYLGEEVHESETLAADQRVLHAVDDRTASWPVALGNDVALLGSEVVVGVVGVALAGWLFARRRILDALLVIGAVGGYVVLTLLVKSLVQRERPIVFFRVPESGYSFPSGHTLGATCLAFALGFLLWRGAMRIGLKVAGTVALILGVLLVAMSRLMLGVHYPTDVLGSMLLGTAWMSALIALRLAVERWQATGVGSPAVPDAARPSKEYGG